MSNKNKNNKNSAPVAKTAPVVEEVSNVAVEVATMEETSAPEEIVEAIAEEVAAPVAEVKEEVKAEAGKPQTTLQKLIAKAAVTGAILAKDGIVVPTAEEKAAAAPVVSGKNKPGGTTYTIEKFSEDLNGMGLKVGMDIQFPATNKPGGGLMTGKIQRIFSFYEQVREEAKILGSDGKRYYRFQKQISLIPAPVVEEVAEMAETTEG